MSPASAPAAAAAAASASTAFYSRTASWLHWGAALPMMGSVGAVLRAQQLPKRSDERQWWMHQHESLGLLTAMILVPRVAYRAFAHKSYAAVRDVPHLTPIEKALSKTTYVGLHGFGVMLSVTGVAMNYISGWGLPFFAWKIPGLPKTDENKQKYGKLAYQMYQVHNQVGYYGKFLIPLHVVGTMKHAVQGQAIYARINPLRRAPPPAAP